jgi:hypothetical protein
MRSSTPSARQGRAFGEAGYSRVLRGSEAPGGRLGCAHSRQGRVRVSGAGRFLVGRFLTGRSLFDCDRLSVRARGRFCAAPAATGTTERWLMRAHLTTLKLTGNTGSSGSPVCPTRRFSDLINNNPSESWPMAKARGGAIATGTGQAVGMLRRPSFRRRTSHARSCTSVPPRRGAAPMWTQSRARRTERRGWRGYVGGG